MTRHFYFITPCGGTRREAQNTVDSVASLAAGEPALEIVHLLLFNNGLAPELSTDGPMNYQPVLIDLGSIASRAAARNAGLDEVASRPAGLVCFLDAGDRVLQGQAIEHAFTTWKSPDELRLWAFSASIVGRDIGSVRRPRSLWLRTINNPFLIGSTYVSSPLATSIRFVEGSKEDWKYWLELLDQLDHDQQVSLHRDVAYEYQVVSTGDHLRRKRSLLRDQYRFFSNYLGHGHGPKTWASMVLHMVIAGTAWVRRSTHLQPWRRRA